MRFVAHSSVWFVRRHKLTIQTGRCNTRWSKENPKPRGSNTLANDWVNSYNSHWRSHSFWRQIFLFRKLCHVALVIHFNFGHNSSRETFHLGLVGFSQNLLWVQGSVCTWFQGGIPCQGFSNSSKSQKCRREACLSFCLGLFMRRASIPMSKSRDLRNLLWTFLWIRKLGLAKKNLKWSWCFVWLCIVSGISGDFSGSASYTDPTKILWSKRLFLNSLSFLLIVFCLLWWWVLFLLLLLLLLSSSLFRFSETTQWPNLLTLFLQNSY